MDYLYDITLRYNRILFQMNSAFINDNLLLIDIYTILQIEYDDKYINPLSQLNKESKHKNQILYYYPLPWIDSHYKETKRKYNYKYLFSLIIVKQ